MVAICTFRRNDPLRLLLRSLQTVAETTAVRARVGVVVVDDNEDQSARTVVDEFRDSFELRCLYRHSGRKNISLARNLAVNTASMDSDWVAMIDDDCEPEPTWLCAFLDVLEATDADCVTGAMRLRVPLGSPAWLSDQPFFDDLLFDFEDQKSLQIAATNNSIIRSSFLRDNPRIRFDPALGLLGGEDMVFYRTASGAGLRIRFASAAAIWGNEPAERATFAHQLRYRFWLGNTEFVTNSYFGDAGRTRLTLRGFRRLLSAMARPFRRMARGEKPQFRYGVASVAGALGLIGGTLGLKKNHPQDEN
jgi:glycosyltransferase involved in cell wall biosynthesis